MARTSFVRLGDHVARNVAAEVRRRARAGDPEAAAELEKIEASQTPEGLRSKAGEIIVNLLNRAELALRDLGYSDLPPRASRKPIELGLALVEWANVQTADRDGLAGRMIHVINICGFALMEWDSPDVLHGFILGSGVNLEYFLALREFSDGPALARERESARGRAEGGKARKNAAKPLHDKIAGEFVAARRQNPRVSASGWANKNAESFGLDPETVRKIAGAALRAAKKRPSDP